MQIIPIVTNVCINLTLQKPFKTVAQRRVRKKGIRMMVHFAKKSNLWSIDFLHFFAKRRKSIEKVIHQNKSRGNRTSKSVKSRKSYSNGHLPYHCSFYYSAYPLMHDVAREFACTIRMRRNNFSFIKQFYLQDDHLQY